MARRLPWFKFFTADWQSDPNLRACSLAARGLWLELCLILPHTEQPGYLIVNGQKPSPETIAGLVGTSDVQGVIDSIAELVARGVPGIDPDGVLYSRRIVAELSHSSKNAQRCATYRARQKAGIKIKPRKAHVDEHVENSRYVARMSQPCRDMSPTENNISHNSNTANELIDATRMQRAIESESESDNTIQSPYPRAQEGGDLDTDLEVNPILQQALNLINRTGIAAVCGPRQQTTIIQLVTAHGAEATEQAIREAVGRFAGRPVEYAAAVLTARLAQTSSVAPAPTLTRTELNRRRQHAELDALENPGEDHSPGTNR